MSEPGGTETGGFAEPQQYTPEQADAIAQAQLASQAEGVAPAQGTGPAVSPADLGAQALAEGARPDEVDTAELLSAIRALQSQVDRLTAEKRNANVPDVVKYSTAFADHLQAKADANPVIHSDPDHTYMPALEHAASMVNASGEGEDIGGHVAFLRRWLDRHARKFPSHDVDYLRELLDDVEESAARAA